MTHDEMIEVIKAHKEGKQLQCRARSSGKMVCTWQDLRKDEKPFWDFPNLEYRAKPEPLVLYARIENNGQIGSVNKRRDLIEKNFKTYGGRVVKLQEVEE